MGRLEPLVALDILGRRVSLEPGQLIGRYRIVRLLAQGGMAEVYRADQELAGGIFRPAALKVIRPEFSESPDFREMFLDEARTACTLSHPNIVHIYEVGELDGLLYMAMELVPGETLSTVGRSLKEKGKRFSDEALLAVGIYTCSALEAVHALKLPGEGHVNLVHRDVSPHNLLLSSTGSLKLIDFGIAKALTNKNLTMPGVTKGKAGYFSPEQAMGRMLDGRSDLFSLGVTLFKLASGFTPFDEYKTHHTRNTALVQGRWPPLEQVCPGLTPGIYKVVNRALQLKPEERYVDAQQMREALEQVAFEAGLQLGQSALAGYVSDTGVIDLPPPRSRSPSGPSARSSPAVGEPRVHRPTERVAKEEPRTGLNHSRIATLSAVGLLLTASLAAAGWFFTRTSTPPVKREAKPAPVALPAAVATEPSAAVDDGGVVEAAAESVAAVEPPPAKTPTRKARPRVPAPPREEPKLAAASPKPVIPKGEGRLRIGVVPDGTVTVAGESWGPAPVERRTSSGHYSVMFERAGKRGSCQATVMPDRTTILIYSFETGACR